MFLISVHHENQRPIRSIGFQKGVTVEERQHSEVTEAIICCFYNVYNKLGYGFLEKVYEKALVVELGKIGLLTTSQHPVTVFYEGEVVGEYFCDLHIENKIIVEVKASKSIMQEHEAQLLNYLKATNVEIGLLLNCGPRPEVRRKLFGNEQKQKQKHNGTLVNAEKNDF